MGELRIETMPNYSEMPDAELVEQIRKTNDPYWFGILYDRYSKPVYNKCLMFIKKPEDAKDLTHDIFLRVFISLSQFKGNALFSTWLYSITYNFCMSFLRKKNIVVELFDNHDTSDEVEIDDQEFLQIRARQLEWALFEISPEERMILLMKYQDDMSIKDIQETLSLGESAVKMRLKRAKSRIVTLCK
ncbi:MAG: hypothetical protein BGO54_09315 [Sphingobacteriales bacterium 46-32]|nr:MAG: hypothetical protein BGO54_09315 [Sphingobacteriales bacterium 46-32]